MTPLVFGVWLCAVVALCSEKQPGWAQFLGAAVFALPFLGYAAGVLR
jgi:hypothetical protein